MRVRRAAARPIPTSRPTSGAAPRPTASRRRRPSPSTAPSRQAACLLRGGAPFAKGLYYTAILRARGVRIVEGAVPLAVEGTDHVTGLRWHGSRGERAVACDAVAIGFGLKPEA